MRRHRAQLIHVERRQRLVVDNDLVRVSVRVRVRVRVRGRGRVRVRVGLGL